MDIIGFIKDHLIIVITIGVLLIIFIYSIFAVTLNKLYKAKYGKTVWIAWIPIINLYLLGQLTIHFLVGIILVILMVLSLGATLTINGIEKYYSILPQNIQEPIAIIFGGITIILFVYARIKANRLISQDGIKGEIADFNNLNRPFIEKKVINETNTKEETDNNIYNNLEANIDEEMKPKISLNSISNHHDDNKENPNN